MSGGGMPTPTRPADSARESIPRSLHPPKAWLAMFLLLSTAVAMALPRDVDRAMASRGSEGPVLPDSGALFGAAVAIGDHTGATQQIATTSVEQLIGRQVTLERMFYDWQDSWPSAYDYWSRDQGRIGLISWS